MAMPPQLARAKRPKRTTPRPIVETLPRIDIADLCRRCFQVDTIDTKPICWNCRFDIRS
jgi:hypothetical protein